MRVNGRDELVAAMNARTRRRGGATELYQKTGVDLALQSRIRSGDRNPPDVLLRELGFEARFVRVDG